MGQHHTACRPRTGRTPANLNLPADLRERLRVVSEETGIPQCRIAEQGLRLRLAQMERAKSKAEPTQ
ncbi:ribbon-helix-helix domain-containing protein [Sorangium sp. So ce204]|uniref:ribbon-helix-helix domain-containing protein n=1 Tax=Sorangium sp. So ce204 TaxID=3133288 RepID=UPI003F632528